MNIISKSSLFALAATAQTFAIMPLQATERALDAHEHGVSKLKVAQEGKVFSFELEAPGSDIVGFEHAAENDAQKAAIKDALAHFQKPELIFALPENAECKATDQKAEFETEEDHAGFHVTWTMTCETPLKATSMTVGFFNLFERAEEVELEAIGNAGQVAIEIEKGQTTVNLSQAIGE